MTDFVLVHGAWHGAWCWKHVVAGLWGRGHRAFAVTLSGVGERAHIAPAGVTLGTHIADVAGVIEAEELEGAVLVGHSYAGMVITGVADRLAPRLRHLVYVDAVLPRPGESWSTGQPATVQTSRRAAIAQHGCLAPPEPSVYGLEAEAAAWVARRQTPHPGGMYDEPLEFDAGRVGALARTYISCTAPALATIDAARARARGEAGWNFIELATGHDPMVSAPEALLDILTRVA